MSAATKQRGVLAVDPTDHARLTNGELTEPHRILGAHPARDARAWYHAPAG